jgi:hypothetical protein
MVLPYLKGLVIILCGFFYLALWIYCVFSICVDYIFRSGIKEPEVLNIIPKWLVLETTGMNKQ